MSTNPPATPQELATTPTTPVPATAGFWTLWWPHLTASVAAGVAIALGAVDGWHFHSWASTTDLALIFSGLGGLGLTLQSAAQRTG